MAYCAPLPSLNRQKRERCYNLDYSNLEFADLNTGQRRISGQSTKWAKAPDSITYSFDNNARFYVNLMGTGCGCNKLTFSCWFLAGLALPHCIQNSTHFPPHLFQNWMQKKKKKSISPWLKTFLHSPCSSKEAEYTSAPGGLTESLDKCKRAFSQVLFYMLPNIWRTS